MTNPKSSSCLLLQFCRYTEIISPLIHAARGNSDRVFGAAEIIAKLAITDVAQDGSLIQTRPRGDLRGFQQLLNGDERVDQVDQLAPRLPSELFLYFLASLANEFFHVRPASERNIGRVGRVADNPDNRESVLFAGLSPSMYSSS
jgi:hypothetical protein